MASLIKGKNKHLSIQLSTGENHKRPKIALGKCTLKYARDSKSCIEALARGEMNTAIQEWIGKLPDGLRTRLERLGLVEKRKGERWTVEAFIRNYIEHRPDVKKKTRLKWEDVERKMKVFFRGVNIGDVTVQQAKNFRVHLDTVYKLKENTIRRHIAIARQFFNAAIDAEVITKNPFRGQPVSLRINKARFFYVTPEMAQKVLDACPDAHWRLIFGLARFGGLRCPSEVLRLKWEDIDFEHDRFTVHATKTEHHANEGIRTVPMFPELKPLFQDAFDEAKEGTVYCLERYRGQWSNVGTHMRRIIKRAGFEPWPKLFQNCRSTRETELFKATGGNVKAVCEWIGNSPQVALKHYAQVTDADLKAAAKMTVLNDAEKRVQNRVHPKEETFGNDRFVNQETNIDNSDNLFNGRNLPNIPEPYPIQDNLCPVGVTGLEPATS